MQPVMVMSGPMFQFHKQALFRLKMVHHRMLWEKKKCSLKPLPSERHYRELHQ